MSGVADEIREKLRPFHAKAVEQGIPADEVDRWIDLARPCAILTDREDGPVAGRFGGPLLLPTGVPAPGDPYLASIDLAALPKDSTDLPLPPDGHLLLFAWTWDASDCGNHGQAIYVPAGTPVEARDANAWNGDEFEECRRIFDSFPQGALRARTEPSLPWYFMVEMPDGGYGPPPGLPHAEKLTEVWEGALGSLGVQEHLQIGGHWRPDETLKEIVHYAVKAAEQGQWGGGEPVSDSVADWVELARWVPWFNVEDVEAEQVHWAIQRADLAARRFDRTFSTVYWNP